MSPRLSARRKGAVYEICPTCGHALRTGTPGKTALAQALFRKRVDGRLTLRAAAGAVGLSPASFYRAEKGEMPAVENAVKFARWLGVSLDALFLPHKPAITSWPRSDASPGAWRGFLLPGRRGGPKTGQEPPQRRPPARGGSRQASDKP